MLSGWLQGSTGTGSPLARSLLRLLQRSASGTVQEDRDRVKALAAMDIYLLISTTTSVSKSPTKTKLTLW